MTRSGGRRLRRALPGSLGCRAPQARARVRLAIEDTLDEGLPRAYTKKLFESKSDAIFEHVYESYAGEGKSVYSATA